MIMNNNNNIIVIINNHNNHYHLDDNISIPELMFCLAVGGDYIGVLDAISIQPPFCTPDPYEQGSAVWAVRAFRM